MNPDPYDNGTPKYSTATDIYDALCVLEQGEEIGFISQFAPDVSYEGQDYYYQDKGGALKDKFDEMTNWGDDMWAFDLAVMQLDASEYGPDVHDLVFEALHNSDLAKRLSFKKLFCDHMLLGSCSLKNRYDEIAEAYANELGELNRFDYRSNANAFDRALAACEISRYYHQTPYQKFMLALSDKAARLRLDKERQLVIECRALLTSYDDFILGIKMNQALYEQQERMWQQRAAELKAGYEQKLAYLRTIAESHGLLPESEGKLKLLGEGDDGQ